MENKQIKEFIEQLKRKQAEVESASKELNSDALYSIKTQDTVHLNNMEDKQQKFVELREERERVCFSIVNRGQVWYDDLTNKQRSELKDWYRAWLDVTKTLKSPPMPEWLK